MTKFEQYGSIKFSPTAVTDKEEVHGLYKISRDDNGNTGIMFVNVDIDDSVVPNNYTADTTYEEINEAINNNCYIVAAFNYGGTAKQFLPLVAYYNEEFMFQAFPLIVRVNNQNNWEVTNYPL